MEFVKRNEGGRQVLDTAFEIEGFARHAGTHAAGVVISEEPLTDIVPLQRIARDENSVMVQHPMSDVEEMARIFPDHPEALENTLKVVESVEDIGMELGKTRLPNFPKPQGYTADAYLREQCERGLAMRYGNLGRRVLPSSIPMSSTLSTTFRVFSSASG